jgi:hypothetical protein
MGLLVHRRLAIPLSAIAYFTAAVTAPAVAMLFLTPPATVFVVAALGVTVMVVLTSGASPFFRASRSPVRVAPPAHREWASPRLTMTEGISTRAVDQPNRSAADDALDLVRMDDDGGWQLTSPA